MYCSRKKRREGKMVRLFSRKKRRKTFSRKKRRERKKVRGKIISDLLTKTCNSRKKGRERGKVRRKIVAEKDVFEKQEEKETESINHIYMISYMYK
jgi:hypothetical protein